MKINSPKRILIVLFATLLLDTIGFGIVIPITPSLFTDPQSVGFLLGQYSPEQRLFLAGLITAVFGLMQFVAAPILGELSDVFGRKRLLLLGVGILAVSQVVFGIGITIGSLGLLFAARIVAGLAAANISIAQATIADVTAPEDRSKNFGLIGAAFGLGFIIGPLLSGWVTHLSGNPATVFWVAGMLGIVNVLLVTFFLPETNHERSVKKKFTLFVGIRNIKRAFNDPDARPLFITSFFYFCGFTFFTSFVGVLLVGTYQLTEANVGTFFAGVGVCMFITQAFILRIVVKRYSERAILRYSIISAAFVVALYPFMPSVWFLALLVPLLAIPQGLTMAVLPALISKGVDKDKQGAALGINGSVLALAQGVVPLIAGVLAGTIGVSVVFIAGAMMMVLAWIVLFR